MLATARAEYRRKVAAHKARKNGGKIYKPVQSKMICRYCKEEGHKVGHFDKELGRFVTTCAKAIEASKRKADYNKRQRQKTSGWQNQVSKTVAEETGSGGWSTAGSKNMLSTATKPKKQVLQFALNPYQIDDESEEDSDGESKSCGPSTATPHALSGAWLSGAPSFAEKDVPAKVELVRAPRKSTTPTSDSSDDAKHVQALSPHSPPPTCWGDEDDDNSAW